MSKCHCGSKLKFSDCCEPIINFQCKANTAEKLMRARYSAYAVGAIDFIEKSIHPKFRKDFDKKSSAQWSQLAKWKSLEVVSTEQGLEKDQKGLVEFKALYSMDDQDIIHHELAEFKKVEDQWFFVDGKQIGPEPVKRDSPKIGRNDPCPCQSSKKYKKCCGR